MIADSLEFTISGNKYEIKDVKVGNFIDFEKAKAQLSGGLYGHIFRMGTVAGDEALTMIDIESFFIAFCPNVLKDLKCNSFRDLGVKDYNEIKKVYVEVLVVWYNNYVNSLRPKKDEE